MQLHARDRMRQEIQNHPCCDSKFLAHEEDLVKFVEAVAFGEQDQFVDASGLENSANLFLVENPDQLQSPIAMIFDVASNLSRHRTHTNNGNVPDIEDALFLNFEEDDSVRNQEKVVDDQRKKDDQAIRLVLVDKKLDGEHDQPGKTYRLGEPKNLM